MYCSVADVRSETGITSSALVSDAFITIRIKAAEAIINSKIANYYVVPIVLADIPDVVQLLCIQIAAALLMKGEYGEEVQGAGIDGEKALSSAMAILDDVQKGLQKLYDNDGVQLTRSATMKPTFYPTDVSTANEDTPRNFGMTTKF